MKEKPELQLKESGGSVNSKQKGKKGTPTSFEQGFFVGETYDEGRMERC